MLRIAYGFYLLTQYTAHWFLSPNKSYLGWSWSWIGGPSGASRGCWHLWATKETLQPAKHVYKSKGASAGN